MLKYLLIMFLFAGYITPYSELEAKTVSALKYKKVAKFIKMMEQKHSFNKQDLQELFGDIQLEVWTKKKITPKNRKQRKKITWNKYHDIFITKKRIADGLKFWQKYKKTLDRAEKKFGVPAKIIVAIIGIETHYGTNKGKHPTLHTLTNKSFNGYRRAKFYKKELEQFLLLTRENSLAPLTIKGSYAGAMGYAQFIASSYRYYAIDFDADGKTDIINNPVDAIGSVANYFYKHKWQKNAPIALKISNTKNIKKLITYGIKKPRKKVSYWRNKDISVPSEIADKTLAKVIRLQLNNGYEHWLTYWNFYAITRYNHDNRYAMVAYQLSEILEKRQK